MLRIASDKPAGPDPENVELSLVPLTRSACKHWEIQIDAELRIVKCKGCGETLDPIQCLLNIHSYVESIRRQFEFIQNYKRAQATKQEQRRLRCRRCNKLFKPVPGEGGGFAHWAICDPCWEKKPTHAD